MTTIVEIEDLSFSYADQIADAISGINLKLTAGTFTAILGPAGSGKSTLCLALTGLISRHIPGNRRGSVRIRGREVADLTVADLARDTGIVFQDFEAQLFATSVRLELAFGPENLAVPRPEILRLVDSYLKLLRLEELDRRSPDSLSGGQKQRLAVAAALTLEPEILVMDEPTSDLDPVSKTEVFQAVRRISGCDRTLVVVEHDSDAIASAGADQVLLMRDGAAVATGPAAELLTNVKLLDHCGVRPPQLADLFHQAGVNGVPLTVDAAAEVLRPRLLAPAIPSPPAQSSRPGAALIRASGLEYTYERAGVPAFSGLDLTLRQGEFLALVGRNGSGKTTLAKTLSGLLRPTAGQLLVRDQPMSRLSRSELVKQVGYVFQNPDHQLFSATASEEVRYGLRNLGIRGSAADQVVAEALRDVGLGEAGEKDPFSLTKGERQRLAIASVLAMRPAILVLDEPTTGLDHRQQRSVLDLLARLNRQGHTIVVVTHTMSIIDNRVTRMVVMNSGRIVLSGDPRTVFRREDVLAEAGVEPPPVVRLGNRLGVAALTVDDLTSELTRAN
jgi:energy-coupling factor transport system ATP-binding protein